MSLPQWRGRLRSFYIYLLHMHMMCAGPVGAHAVHFGPRLPTPAARRLGATDPASRSRTSLEHCECQGGIYLCRRTCPLSALDTQTDISSSSPCHFCLLTSSLPPTNPCPLTTPCPITIFTGLWDWSMKYMDGTTPSNFNPEDVDPAKMKW